MAKERGLNLPDLQDIELELKEYIGLGFSPEEAASEVSREYGISIHEALQLAESAQRPVQYSDLEDLVFKDSRVVSAYSDAEEWFMNRSAYEIADFIQQRYVLKDREDGSEYEVIPTFQGELIGTVQTRDHSDFSNSFSVENNVDEFLWYLDQEVLFGYKEDNEGLEDSIIEGGQSSIDYHVDKIVNEVFPKVKSRYVQVLAERYLDVISNKVEAVKL